jgi:hypothetical protein
MKNKYLLALAAICFSSLLSAQIPNHDFENWTDAGFYDVCDEWITNYGDFVPVSAQKDSDAYSGFLAAKLINYAVDAFLYSGFPVTFHPHHLTAFIKGNVAANDSIFMNVILYKNGLPIDSGKWVSYNSISAYTQEMAVISTDSPDADSAYIYFSGGHESDTWMLVDQLQFDDVTNAIPAATADPDPIVIANPFHTNLSLKINTEAGGMLQIINPSGQEIYSGKFAPGLQELEVNLAGHTNGIYLCVFNTEKTVRMLKVVKQ